MNMFVKHTNSNLLIQVTAWTLWLGGMLLAFTKVAWADVPPEPEEIASGWLDEVEPLQAAGIIAAILACFTGSVIYYIHRHYAPTLSTRCSAKTPYSPPPTAAPAPKSLK